MEEKKQKATEQNEELINILKSNNLYKDLYQILCDNDIDLDVLQNDVRENEIDDFCNDLNIKGVKKVKFRKLFRILTMPKTTQNSQIDDDFHLKSFIENNKLPQKLYNILINENIKFNQLNSLTSKDIDYICNNNNIKIGTKIQFKKLIQNISMTQNPKIYHQQKSPNPNMKILVIGDKGVGKTSLIKRYTQNIFHDDGTFNDDNDNYIYHTEQLGDGTMIDIEICDACMINTNYIAKLQRANAILLCYDKNDEKTFNCCLKLKEQIIQSAKSNVIIILVSCKVDQGYSNREMEETKSQNALNNLQWNNQINIFSLECSAKTGINVKNIFLTAAERYMHNIDLTNEDIICDELIDIALGHDQTINWKSCESGDKDIIIECGFTGTDKQNQNIITLRSYIYVPVNVSCDEFYDFVDARKDNFFNAKHKFDSLNIEIRPVKTFDNNRCLVYSAYKAAIPNIISPRDFCYLQIRKKYKDYKNKHEYIVAVIGYSVNDKFDGYVPIKKDRVRAHLFMTGFVFEKIDENQSRVYYVVKLDPRGSIPNFIVNSTIQKKGYDIEWIRDHLPKLVKQK